MTRAGKAKAKRRTAWDRAKAIAEKEASKKTCGCGFLFEDKPELVFHMRRAALAAYRAGVRDERRRAKAK